MKNEYWNEGRIEKIIWDYWILLKAKEYSTEYTAELFLVFIDTLLGREA